VGLTPPDLLQYSQSKRPMTLPEFSYPDQRPAYCEGLARRILDCEHDDLMDAEDYDRRRAIRDGWTSDTEGRW
jgi:hypothetical protein